jgi:hypothetical protein
MYKLRRKYHNLTIWHPVMGKVTLYKEADQQLLAVWHKHFPESVEWKAPVIEEKPKEDDNTEAEH